MAKSSRRRIPASGASTPSAGPIAPFVKAPSTLASFLEPLSPREVYLVHIDTTPIDVKWQAFLVPCVVNTIVTAILALRVWMGLSTYPALFAIAFGSDSSLSIDYSQTGWLELARIILQRTGAIFIDYFLVTQFLHWPVNFIFGPVLWRRAIGFRDREIVVRCSNRSWSKKLKRNTWIRDDEANRDKIIAAVTPERTGKTGYLLVDEDWNLDYAAMTHAQKLVDRNRRGDGVQLDEFRLSVLVHTDADGWCIWRVADENVSHDKERSEHRDQIMAFKDKLTALGKEDLFFRWVEIVQWESSQPGGFTPERQKSAMQQVQQMFNEAGVDFSSFWDDLGGMTGLEQLD
ncbi:hypothetical protein N7468_004127 [Penicillium chermesinum]|uniref:Uncharacterized protein n=1 Tax=Penicillium chermesinum TaxID=63820 RepID=A0A9W9P7V0_9EURO|nr:uncharacterized protein N7468_004127 [Penicillium chermesinum]KAJ5239508.1 hypothetical protein N7468_004127 [Penicillium chermesinum]